MGMHSSDRRARAPYPGTQHADQSYRTVGPDSPAPGRYAGEARSARDQGTVPMRPPGAAPRYRPDEEPQYQPGGEPRYQRGPQPGYQPDGDPRYRRGGALRRLSGADGNERLTAITGAVLLVLLAVEGFTIVAIRPLLPVHFFVGMLLVGPVLLKACSTTYRFARYYSGAPEYRRKGPPNPLLRLIGPFVLLSSLAVLGTGVALAFAGPGNQQFLFLHKASFVIWFILMMIHVLAYVWRVPGLIAADLRGSRGTGAGGEAALPATGRAARWAAVTVALVSGLILAAATLHLAVPWQVLGR
jgi:hypothetical protein